MATRSELTARRLAERVIHTLRTKAEGVTLSDRAFDPQREGLIDADVEIHLHEGRDGRAPRLVLSAVAAVLVVVALGTAALLRADDHDGGPATTTREVPPTVTASVDLPSATLEVHQRGGAEVLCLRPTGGGDLRCGGGLTANLVVEGTWYVAVAETRTAPRPLIASGWGDPPFVGDPGMLDLDSRALPTQTGEDRDWAFTLAIPPADTDLVWLREGTRHSGLTRPPADSPPER